MRIGPTRIDRTAAAGSAGRRADAQRGQAASETKAAAGANLPVTVEPVARAERTAAPRTRNFAPFIAQLLGQARPGLSAERAARRHPEAARTAYDAALARRPSQPTGRPAVLANA